MATFKLVLRKEKIKENGEAPIYLRVTKNRRTKYISLQLNVLPELWDSEKGRVKKGYPNAIRVNRFLAQKEADARGVSVDMESQDSSVTAVELKNVVSGRSSISFLDYCDSYQHSLEYIAKAGTLDKFKAVVSKVRKYLNGKQLLLNEITVFWLRNYETYLRKDLGNTNNTVHSNLKVIRRVLNKAVEEDLLPYEKNPFLKYKLKWEKTTKVFLSEDELKRIEELTLRPNQNVLSVHRDMFVFACYAGGLRVSDLLFLKWKDVSDDRLLLVMEKTSDQLYVPLVGKAKEILSKYRQERYSEQRFVFPLLDENNDFTDKTIWFRTKSSQTAFYNKHLKVLAEMADIDKPVTSHTARHTFATRALNKGMGIEYVSRLMGHTNIKTTQVYAKIVNKDLDRAMEVFN